MEQPRRQIPRWTGRARAELGRGLLWLGLAALWFSPVLFSSEALLGSGTDLVAYQYPIRQFAFGQLRHGHWPLWNPYIFSGLPFLATGFQSPLHPLSWVSALLSPTLEVKVSCWLCLALAGWSMGGLLAELGFGRAGCMLGGLLWMGGAQSSARIYAGHLDVLLGLAHLPWLSWAVLWAVRRGWRAAWGPALVLALSVSTGHYHLLYLSGWTAVWLSLSELARCRLRPGSWLRVWGLTAGLGLSVTCFQWISLPSVLSWVGRGRLGLQEAATGPTPAAALTWLWPHLFEGVEPHTAWCPWPSWEGQLYLGLPTLLLAVWGSRWRWSWLLGAVFFATLAGGTASPLYGWLFQLDPLLSKFRVPFRFGLVSQALLVCLAVAGYERLERRRALALTGLGGLLLWLMVLLLPSFDGLYLSCQPSAAPPEQWSMLLQRSWPALGCSLVGLLALGWAPQPWERRGLSLALALDLWLLAQPWWGRVAPQQLEIPAPIATAMAAVPGARSEYAPELFWYDRGAGLSLSSMGGYDRLADWRYMRAAGLALGLDVRVNTTLLAGYTESAFWSLQGVRYAVGTTQAPGPGYRAGASAGPLQLFENPQVQPRAFLVDQVEAAPAAQALEQIATGRLDATTQVVVDPALFDDVIRHLGNQPEQRRAGRVSSLQLECDSLRIRVEAPQPAVLVVTDAPYPGWSCRLDGRPVPILAVNGWLHRAALIPTGSHLVEMSYRPPHFRLGLLVSLAGLLSTAVLAALDRRWSQTYR